MVFISLVERLRTFVLGLSLFWTSPTDLNHGSLENPVGTS